MGNAAEQMILVSASDLQRMVREALRAELAQRKSAEEPEYLTTAQVAELLQMSSRNISNLVAAGMPSLRCGSERRFRRADVAAWMERRGRTPVSELRAKGKAKR